MLEAGKAWKEIEARGRKPTWSEWTTIIGPGLVEARAEALGVTRGNRPIGRAYNTAMSALLKEYGLERMNRTVRVYLFKVMREPRQIEEWRARQKKPDDLNNPVAVWRRYKKSTYR
jgi:hypothetical protein